MLVIPADITFEATGILTVLDIGSATAIDNSDSLDISNDATSDLFPLGTTTITWSVVDSSGNISADIQRITIQDTTSPVFDGIDDITSDSMIVNFDIPQATDIFPISVECNYSSGDTFDIGTTRVSCIATDTNDNTTNVSFNVIISSLETNDPVVTITSITNNGVFVDFTDGFTTFDSLPKFRGTSENVSYLKLDIDGIQVGNSITAQSNGDWQRGWMNAPLDQKLRKEYLKSLARSSKSSHLKILKKAKSGLLQQKVTILLNKGNASKLKSLSVR